MADLGVQYVLSTGSGTITFNQFTDPFTGQDQYYLTNDPRGLAAPALRTPFDSVPLGDGALVHDFWFGARHIGVEGTILVQSVRVEDDIVLVRNQMEADLTDALNSIIRTDGTFAFTPSGQSAVSYTVRYEVALEFIHSSNFNMLDFSFGLIAADPFA